MKNSRLTEKRILMTVAVFSLLEISMLYKDLNLSVPQSKRQTVQQKTEFLHNSGTTKTVFCCRFYYLLVGGGSLYFNPLSYILQKLKNSADAFSLISLELHHVKFSSKFILFQLVCQLCDVCVVFQRVEKYPL